MSFLEVGRQLIAFYTLLNATQPALSPRLKLKRDGRISFCSSTRIEWKGKDYLLTAGHCCGGTEEVTAEGKVVTVLDYQYGSGRADLCLLSAPSLDAVVVGELALKDAPIGSLLVGSGHTLAAGYQVFHCPAGPSLPGPDPIRESRCPAMPGYSGGGVWSLEGRLVGVTSIRYGNWHSLGFVPLSHIYTFLLNAGPAR